MPIRIRSASLLLVAIASSFALACHPRQEAGDDVVEVVATTTMLGDMVRVLVGDDLHVTTIMQPGADPHLYRPTPSDAGRVARSDLVVVNGLHLEGWAQDLVENAGGTRPTVTAATEVDVIRMEGFAGGVDPHFWFDTRAWRAATEHVARGLAAVAPDEDTAHRIEARASAYLAVLSALDAWIRRTLETIPVQHRVLVTSHDAFNYFARAYDLQVEGIQGISTESEASQRDVANIVELVRRTGAPAVFTETSVNPTLIERVAAETGAAVAGPLYSDSLGPPGGPADTYVDMVVENVRMISDALGGSFQPFQAP